MSSVPRFYIPSPLHDGVEPLPPDVARQVATVLRLRPGAAITLFNGDGAEWHATLETVSPRGATARLRQRELPQRESPVHLTLYQAMLKGEKFGWVIQKATELGVAAIVPLLTARTVVDSEGKRPDRWQRIAIEAAEQSGRTVVPEIRAPQRLEEALARLAVATVTPEDSKTIGTLETASNDGASGAMREDSGASAIFCWESASDGPMLEAARRILQHSSCITIFIGPEGGFTPDEAALAQQHGAAICRLGPRILRSETAAIAAAAVVLLGANGE